MSASDGKFRKLKKFVSFYKPYRLLFAADVTCASVTSVAALAIPLCIRSITAEALAPGAGDPWPLAARTLVVMLGLILVQTGCGIFYDYKGHAMGAMMERDMRSELFDHVQRLPLGFFDRRKTGAIMTRISGDLLTIAEVCHHGPEDLLISLVRFVGAFVVLFRIEARLTLVIFALLPFMVVYTIFFQRRLRRVYRENREKIGELNAGLEDSLSGIRVVKSFANEELENKKFRAANQVFYQSRAAIYRNEAFYYSAMDYFFAPLVIAGAIAAGGLLISRASLGAPDLIVFLLYVGYLTAPLTRIAGMVGLIQDGIVGFNRFMELKDMKPELPVEDESKAGNPREPIRLKGHVEFKNASFRYGEGLDNVLENVSLEIKPGESIALVGSSGAGKTTLCSLVPRFYEPNAGSISLDGIDARAMDLKTLRQNIGLIAQDVYLFGGTVFENIEYGRPGASKDDIVAAAKKAHAHDFITALPKGYGTEIGQRGIRLSGGQRQRLSIARAFLKDPPILILDEATSALDYETEEVIHESLEAFMKDRTVLIISHRPSTVRMAKKVYSLSKRNIEEITVSPAD